ncbi:SIMPL domain-containing protein [Denitratisoma sp. agr-D3]
MRAFALLLGLLIALPVQTTLAAPTTEAAKGTLVDFTVEARQSAPNDQGSATAFMEADAASPAELARKVNGAIAQALALAKKTPAVQTRSGNTWTSPIYGKNDRAIVAWRMRSELLLESRDLPALAELVGQLQNTLGVGQIHLQPAPETRGKAEDQATQDAIALFRDKAKQIARQLGRDYRIVQLNVNSSRGQIYAPKAMALRAEAAALPLEAGESQVTVTVSGQIEVLP